MKSIILAHLLIPFTAGKSSAEQESSKVSNDAMRRLRSLVFDEGSMPADFLSFPVNGAIVEGSVGASKTSVRTMPSAKSSKTGSSHSGVCHKRLIEAFELVKGRVPGIEEPEDVTELCSFVTPTYEDPRYNLGCPFVFFSADYTGTGVPLTNFFPKGVKEYEEIFITLFGEICEDKVAAAEGKAAASVALYCSCYQGYDLGCSNELPSTPQEKDEYCEFAGVWNGDFNSSDVELSSETNKCGCFWISQVTNEVGKCPGVDLGEFFPLPYPPQKCPFNSTNSTLDTLSALSAYN